MKKIVGFLVLVLLMSCKQTITESDLNNLNGYWEIEKVILLSKESKVVQAPVEDKSEKVFLTKNDLIAMDLEDKRKAKK
jgi:hypothetical protein